MITASRWLLPCWRKAELQKYYVNHTSPPAPKGGFRAGQLLRMIRMNEINFKILQAFIPSLGAGAYLVVGLLSPLWGQGGFPAVMIREARLRIHARHYRSPSYETNSPILFCRQHDGAPAGGRNYCIVVMLCMPNWPHALPFPNTNEGYEAAGKELHNPLEKTEANMTEGKRLYENYCIHCMVQQAGWWTGCSAQRPEASCI